MYIILDSASIKNVYCNRVQTITNIMDVLQSLPSDLSAKTNANELNVSVPVAAAAALQMTTNFLNSVG